MSDERKAEVAQPIFDSTVELFMRYMDQYLDLRPKAMQEVQLRTHLGVEILERLGQLDFIVRRVRQIGPQYLGDGTTRDLELEVRTLTEMFYYIAARIQTVLSNKHLPELHTFSCPSVTLVRNKLIEHPEKGDSGVVMQSFGWGEELGPVIKAGRRPDQTDRFPDRGLFINAEDFRVRLEAVLTRALKASK